MDTAPIYELRERIRTAAIAGTNLLSEDYRLRHAYDAFKPLEEVSPVFAKVGQLTMQLLSPDCQNPQGALLDTITLVDAVICTLGTVDIKGDIEPVDTVKTKINANHLGSLTVNVPCSIFKELSEALTTTGSGYYGYICDMHENHPEFFSDYRIKYELVLALGASYAQLADNAQEWLMEENDRMILPLLYKDFDPKGKKEMVRRVRIIDAIAGADANDFYTEMLDRSQKDIRLELINALRHEQKNVPLLIELSKTEKGKNKDAVFEALTNMEEDSAAAYLRGIAEKKPDTALKCLKNATSAWSAELVEEICDCVLEKFDKLGAFSDLSRKEQDTVLLLYHLIRAMFGKSGDCISRCYRKLLARNEKINYFLEESRKCGETNPLGQLKWEFDILRDDLGYCERLETNTVETALGMVLQQTLIINPDSDLQVFAMELYEENSLVDFFPAAVTVKFLRDEDCVSWLEEQLAGRGAIDYKKRLNVAAAYIGWKGKNYGYHFYGKCNSSCQPGLLSVDRPIKLSHAKDIIELFMKFYTEKADGVLARWIPLDDGEMRKKMGEHFYKRALMVTNIDGYNKVYLEYMKLCGWKNCRGLGVKLVKTMADFVKTWELSDWLTMWSWDKDIIMEEARAICDMVKSGEVKVKCLNIGDFERCMDFWYKKQ